MEFRYIFISGLIFSSIILMEYKLLAVPSIDVSIFFNYSQSQQVRAGNILTRSFVNGHPGFNTSRRNSPFGIPEHPLIPETVTNYEAVTEERAFFPLKVTESSNLKVYNMFFAYSGLEGMSYYSRTDDDMNIFLEESYRIADPENLRRIPDMKFSGIQRKTSNYFMVSDNRFGRIIFKSETFANGNSFLQRNRSVHSLSKLGFSIAGRGEYILISVCIASEQNDGFYWYVMHAVNVRSSILMKAGFLNSESFANRARAETVHRAGLLGLDWSGKIRAQ